MPNNSSNSNLEAALAEFIATTNQRFNQTDGKLDALNEALTENTRQIGRLTEMMFSQRSEMAEIKSGLGKINEALKSHLTIAEMQAQTAKQQAESIRLMIKKQS